MSSSSIKADVSAIPSSPSVIDASDFGQTSHTSLFCGCCSLKAGTLSSGILTLALSAATVILNAIRYAEHDYYLGRSDMIVGIIGWVASVLCIYGAVKECRYSLLPWLIFTAISLSLSSFTAFYYIIFGSLESMIVGLVLFLTIGLFAYFWTCVAKYYNELGNRARANDNPVLPTRHFINPSAVIHPAAFSSPPSYYNGVIGADNALFDEKPPRYEQVAEKKEKTNCEEVKKHPESDV